MQSKSGSEALKTQSLRVLEISVNGVGHGNQQKSAASCESRVKDPAVQTTRRAVEERSLFSRLRAVKGFCRVGKCNQRSFFTCHMTARTASIWSPL
jgi:hypothetical protein